jgi:hypothetical protein
LSCPILLPSLTSSNFTTYYYTNLFASRTLKKEILLSASSKS